MKRPLTPQEKKAYAYQKEHFVAAEYPHLFRRSWPLKKARSKRAYRRKVKQSLEAFLTQDVDELEAQSRVSEIRKKMPRKWPVLTLRGWLDVRRGQRTHRFARHLFRLSYYAEAHQSRFSSLLASLPKTSEFYGPYLAETLGELLQRPTRPVLRPINNLNWRRVWLHDFLRDEPEWEARLQEWITDQGIDITQFAALEHLPSAHERVRR